MVNIKSIKFGNTPKKNEIKKVLRDRDWRGGEILRRGRKQKKLALIKIYR